MPWGFSFSQARLLTLSWKQLTFQSSLGFSSAVPVGVLKQGLTGNAPCPDLRGRNEIPAFPWQWRTGWISALYSRWILGKEMHIKAGDNSSMCAYINQGFAALLKTYFFNLSVCQWRIFHQKTLNICRSRLSYIIWIQTEHLSAQPIVLPFSCWAICCWEEEGSVEPPSNSKGPVPCQCKSGPSFQCSGVRNKILIRMDHAVLSANSQGETGSH